MTLDIHQFKTALGSSLFKSGTLAIMLFLALGLSSCSDDDVIAPLESSLIEYAFHNGQIVAAAPYAGIHPGDFSASMNLEELANGKTNITITLQNTIDGATYRIHAHDAADAASTPNGTPYTEAPNSTILAQAIDGNGGTVTVSQEAEMSYDELINNYAGFFVVHDPLQAVNTADVSTFLIVSTFARPQTATSFESKTFAYDFNTGQLSAGFVYNGAHTNTLSAQVTIGELADGRARVAVQLMNTMDGEVYGTHAHDAADAASTPNGTPYQEMPNSDVFATAIAGNGGTAGFANISSSSFNELTTNYDGFFVVHDPLQALNTADPTTFIVLGVFAR